MAYLRNSMEQKCNFDMMYWQLEHFNTLLQTYFRLNWNLIHIIVRCMILPFFAHQNNVVRAHFVRNSCMINDGVIRNATFIDLLRSFNTFHKQIFGDLIPYDYTLVALSLFSFSSLFVCNALNFKGVNFVNWLEIFGSIIHLVLRNIGTLRLKPLCVHSYREQGFSMTKNNPIQVEPHYTHTHKTEIGKA